MTGRELNFVAAPKDLEDYLCPVCAKVLVDPHVTECCGQHFCEQCLKKWFRERGRMICPHCRSTKFTHIRYLPLKRKINELLVYCSNGNEGCTISICVGELDDHLKTCPYGRVACFNRCGLSVLRKDLSDHASNQCPKRPTTCTYCNKRGEYQFIVGPIHQKQCPDYPVGCPKRCIVGGQVKRKDLYKHKLVCLLEPVQCPDCHTRMPRQELNKHRQNTCSKRIVHCDHCHKQIRYDALNMHHQKCREYPVICPRECELGKTGLKRKDLHSHSQVCLLEPQTCYNCKARLIRGEMDMHCKYFCPKRKTECPYNCGTVGAYDQITGAHVNECCEFPVGCPRKCDGGDQIKRKCLKAHTEECLLEPVQCPFDDIGCKPQLVREDLSNHLESSMQQHMLKLMTAHSKLKSELASSLKKQSEMTMTLNTMTSSISHELNLMVQKGYYQGDAAPLQCIRTALNPNLKDVKDTLKFRVPQIKQKWSSLPFHILDGYKMCLVFETDCMWAWTRAASDSTTSTTASLHLMKGENDSQLIWPIKS